MYGLFNIVAKMMFCLGKFITLLLLIFFKDIVSILLCLSV